MTAPLDSPLPARILELSWAEAASLVLEFPVYLRLGPLALHPHWVFETLAYLVGSRVYLWRKQRQGDAIPGEQRWWIVVAAAVGAALGSKLLYLASDPPLTLEHWRDPFFLMAGKSVVGALVGGLVAVEWSKRLLGVTRSTGDLFAIPLAVGISIGRVGCFLTGLDDHTHGIATSLPWAVDFGDGVPRHPTQLYEILFLLGVMVPLLWWQSRRPHREGGLFRLLMAGYLGFRLVLELIKPAPAYLGLNVIQWVCLATLVYYALLAYRDRAGAAGVQLLDPDDARRPGAAVTIEEARPG